VVGSEWVRRRTGDLVERDWTPTFTTDLLRKDFDLGLEAARSLEVPMPVAALVQQLIQSATGGSTSAPWSTIWRSLPSACSTGPVSTPRSC
jgi:3-hydroxyisobutyrate dehydrogenase-like beta-hydroxyacid dehydrogenase